MDWICQRVSLTTPDLNTGGGIPPVPRYSDKFALTKAMLNWISYADKNRLCSWRDVVHMKETPFIRVTKDHNTFFITDWMISENDIW
jgi:hypothetical protein